MAEVAAGLRASGLAMRHQPLHHDGMVVAWAIQAWREAQA
jgi:hypothetical protein